MTTLLRTLGALALTAVSVPHSLSGPTQSDPSAERLIEAHNVVVTAPLTARTIALAPGTLAPVNRRKVTGANLRGRLIGPDCNAAISRSPAS